MSLSVSISLCLSVYSKLCPMLQTRNNERVTNEMDIADLKIDLDVASAVNNDEAAECAAWKPMVVVPREAFFEAGVQVQSNVYAELEHEEFTTIVSVADNLAILANIVSGTRVTEEYAECVAGVTMSIKDLQAKYEALQAAELSATFWDEKNLQEEQILLVTLSEGVIATLEEAVDSRVIELKTAETALRLLAESAGRVPSIWEKIKDCHRYVYSV